MGESGGIFAGKAMERSSLSALINLSERVETSAASLIRSPKLPGGISQGGSGMARRSEPGARQAKSLSAFLVRLGKRAATPLPGGQGG